jgi:hypothetical protein
MVGGGNQLRRAGMNNANLPDAVRLGPCRPELIAPHGEHLGRWHLVRGLDSF